MELDADMRAATTNVIFVDEDMVDFVNIQDDGGDGNNVVNLVTSESKMTRKRRLQAIPQVKEKVPIIEDSIQCMLEDFLHSLVTSCNMVSIIRDGNPRSCREPCPAPTPQGSIIMIDWLQNSVTYQDHSKGVIILIVVYRYNVAVMSLAITSSIQDPLLRSVRITHLPMTP